MRTDVIRANRIVDDAIAPLSGFQGDRRWRWTFVPDF
jgi:hypothetical protein